MISDEIQVDAIAGSLERGRVTRVRLFGRSMMPLVFPGTELRFEPISPRDCEPGDVVLVRRGDALTAHRWVGGSKGAWVLRGDAFEHADPPVDDAQILGRAIGLPIASVSLPLPRPLQRVTTRALVGALPLLREASSAARAIARSLWRGAQRSSFVHGLRKRTARWTLERFEAHHMPEIRRMSLARSTRPERALLRGWQQILESPRSVAFLARSRGRIVGHAIVREDVDPSFGICGFLWVSRGYRGLGLASELLSMAIDHVRPLAYRELHADVRRGSDALRAFTRLGFELAPDLPVRNARRLALRLRVG